MQNRKELRGFSHIPAEFPGSSVCRFHFRGREALGGHQDRPQVGLQVQFTLGTLKSVWEGLQHLQRFDQVTNGFEMGRAFNGALTGPLQ